MFSGKDYAMVNGEKIYPLSKEEYKDMHKDKIKSYKEKWNTMTEAEKLNMIMYAQNRYSMWIRGIKEPEGYTNQHYFMDRYEINAWKDEALEEYINDR